MYAVSMGIVSWLAMAGFFREKSQSDQQAKPVMFWFFIFPWICYIGQHTNKLRI